jgi:glycyl-tRNA synthetase beta chain
MSDLLLELYIEEIPARMQQHAEAGYKEIFIKHFADANISYDSLETHVGPRRLTLYVSGIIPVIAGQEVELRGPKTNAPEMAIEGFCKSQNITRTQLSLQTIKDQEYYIYQVKTEDKLVESILPSVLSSALSQYVWPKSMCWGGYDLKWVRPLKNILCLFDERVLDFSYFHLKANDKTFGHRFMSYHELQISGWDDYKKQLADNYVMLSRQERKSVIETELTRLVSEKSLVLSKDDRLLEEVAALVEYPNVLLGSIPEKFMDVPSEILVTAMRIHQRYFTVQNTDGSFAPYFLFVSNLKSDDSLEIIAGNEKVLSARLSDSAYFYKQDQLCSLESRFDRLSNTIFHRKLGSIKDKVERTHHITKFLDKDDKELHMAALLCKSDLLTEVVGEFPELQGIMGGYYAKIEGFSDNITSAIRLHYKPEGPDEDAPTGMAGKLALADKIDSLVALYTAGERSTGSKDPYALRRYALGIIRIIIASKLELDITKLLSYAGSLVGSSPDDLKGILLFLEDRLKSYMKNSFDQGIVASTVNLEHEPDIYITLKRAEVIGEFINKPEGKDLLAAYNRARSILSSSASGRQFNSKQLVENSEKALYEVLENIAVKIDVAVAAKNFVTALELLPSMLGPINKFFDEVTVKDQNQELANNRIALLERVVLQFHKLANFSEI